MGGHGHYAGPSEPLQPITAADVQYSHTPEGAEYEHTDANVWQIAASTSAIAVMSILAIFWNELYSRSKPSVYLCIFWLCSVLPLGAIAFTERAGVMLALVLISAAGMGGLRPISGDFLRSCFPPITRSRVWSIITVVEQPSQYLDPRIGLASSAD